MTEPRIALLLTYLEEDPEDAFSRYALGLEYVKIKELDKARACFQELKRRAPDYLPLYYHYGKLLEHTGDTEEAVRIYEEGIALAEQRSDQHTRSELQGALLALTDLDG